MLNYNQQASGQVFRVNLGQDISTGTAFSMTFEPSSGEKIEVVPALGTTDTVVGDEKFLANQFVEYTLLANQFPDDETGRWRTKATVTLASGEIVSSNYILFRVMP